MNCFCRDINSPATSLSSLSTLKQHVPPHRPNKIPETDCKLERSSDSCTVVEAGVEAQCRGVECFNKGEDEWRVYDEQAAADLEILLQELGYL